MQQKNSLRKGTFARLLTVALLGLNLALVSCSGAEKPEQKKAPEVLTEIKDGVFTEYYPGRKNIKFQGMLDENNQRQGKWVFYTQTGGEQSVTFYEGGKKHGHSIVKYPNGALYFYGEYSNDQKIGVWKTYGTDGKLVDSTDFGGL